MLQLFQRLRLFQAQLVKHGLVVIDAAYFCGAVGDAPLVPANIVGIQCALRETVGNGLYHIGDIHQGARRCQGGTNLPAGGADDVNLLARHSRLRNILRQFLPVLHVQVHRDAGVFGLKVRDHLFPAIHHGFQSHRAADNIDLNIFRPCGGARRTVCVAAAAGQQGQHQHHACDKSGTFL